ncbi:PUA domain-containing protein [Staphylothermus hellenicus]|uniref:PUA domain containing protein n=1 Tax=Staphylothermus hellenicus (strain DSM 12710 / JCM 10830 / BK20S6-10-b1 / P8) TaxID=591019 RepID=D7DA44_STAHD|nr:PUA domain-containing protein [Staphylothermus hellenicus]ADI32640.1 PUA domain containing protein [Staphylothermus hellenicus DSM 12710]
MIKRRPSVEELEELRTIADLEFRGVGRQLIPDDIVLVISPSTMKIRYLLFNNEIYLSLRAGDYRFILHVPAGRVLNKILPHPHLRIYVNSRYSGFIASGGNVFCKHVVMADPNIKPGDEVLVVDSDSYKLLGVGRAIKPGWEITYYRWGEAVRIREGVLEE